MSSPPRSLQTEAVVLRHSEFGEADRLLVLFTRDLGKVRALAKGARKVRSRKAGHLEPFTRVKVQLARGRDLFIVTQAETQEAHIPLREDLIRLGYASYVVELLDRSTIEDGEQRGLYTLLTDTLSRLTSASDPSPVVRYFEIRLLDVLGYRPQLFHCVECQAEILPEDQFFSFDQGGVLCPQCGSGQTRARPISVSALKYLRHFQRSSYPEAMRAAVSSRVMMEMEQLLLEYLTYVLERHFNAPVFLRRVRR